ncbi:MAG: alpha/beta fold hydrolase [Alphaproteobacteria bacterium]|nr:alpha/beta fold hydrolase [Alphaproteobacteria bacterium]
MPPGPGRSAPAPTRHARPALVLLPGLLCDAALWRAQSEGLADAAEIRVADLTTQESMAAMAETALSLVPGRFCLAGLSMGGYVALEVMRRAPDRVAKLALLATSARADSDAQLRRRRDLVALAEKGNFKGVTPRLLPLFLHPDRLADASLVGEVSAMAKRVGPDAFLRQQKAIMDRPDSRPGLARIGCPTLVLCGRQDGLTPLAWSEEIATGIPGACLEAIEDCGHLATMERPDQVNAALRAWLAA